MAKSNRLAKRIPQGTGPTGESSTIPPPTELRSTARVAGAISVLRPVPLGLGPADRRERGPVRRDRPDAVVRPDRRRPLPLHDRDGVGRRDDRGR